MKSIPIIGDATSGALNRDASLQTLNEDNRVSKQNSTSEIDSYGLENRAVCEKNDIESPQTVRPLYQNRNPKLRADRPR